MCYREHGCMIPVHDAPTSADTKILSVFSFSTKRPIQIHYLKFLALVLRVITLLRWLYSVQVRSYILILLVKTL